MNSDLRRPLKSRQTRWARWLAARLAAAGATANQISVAGIVFAALGGGALAMAGTAACASHVPLLLFTGAAGTQLRLLCNLLDGMVAVEGGKKGRAGELFNEMPDRAADLLLLIGAGIASGAPALGWAAGAVAVLAAYVRAFGASLGQGQDFCGPGAKPHRMFVLTVACLAAIAAVWIPQSAPPAAILRHGLWLIITLASVTALRRTARLYRKLP